jgi:hypothetical protein
MIGPATVGEKADEGVTRGVSAGAGLCEWGIIKTTTNVRAKPAVGNAIQPAHPAAGMMRRRICRSQDLGRGSDTGGGASPCHSHKPASLLSVLIKTASAEGDIGASSFTATTSPYAGPIDPLCSACIATIPSQLQHRPLFSPSAPLDGISARTGFETASSRRGEAHRRAKPSSFRSEGTTKSPICGRVAHEARFGPATRLKAREDDRK